MLLPEYTARPEFRESVLFREAKISATLDHANIVHTFDLVESDESLFIVMEYVRGVYLRTTIIRRAKLRRRELSTAAALHITLEVLAGLSYAHNRQARPNGSSMAIIHRDVSPSNIPLLRAGRGEALRLRHRQGGHPLFGVLPGARQGRLHVARAGPQRTHRPPHRSVFGRGLPL